MQGKTARGAAGDELKLAGNMNTMREGRGAQEYTLHHVRPEKKVPSESLTPKVGCLGQPRLTFCFHEVRL